ncbi:MAG: hypothetical protein E5W90_26355 [Mesorhizobium sp.]|nr:MAG: hypothetical protein E5W90_26355 [Mesorhizobium sp.]
MIESLTRSNFLFLRNSQGESLGASPGKTAAHFSWNYSRGCGPSPGISRGAVHGNRCWRRRIPSSSWR